MGVERALQIAYGATRSNERGCFADGFCTSSLRVRRILGHPCLVGVSHGAQIGFVARGIAEVQVFEMEELLGGSNLHHFTEDALRALVPRLTFTGNRRCILDVRPKEP